MPKQNTPLPSRMVIFASRQHGIVDWRELSAAGIAGSTVNGWVASGRLFRLYRGVYCVIPPSMLTVEGRWLAAVKRMGLNAFLGLAPACQLGGVVPRSERHALHIVLADRSRRDADGIAVHRPRNFLPIDTTTRLRIPTTTVTRALWDMASSHPREPFRKALARARSYDRVDYLRLGTLLEQSPSHAGSPLIRELLTERIIPLSEVRSWLEELLLEICHEHGLPLPAVNAPLLGYEPDFLWERERVIVEADGGDHMDREQRDRDNERDAVLQRHGFLVRRFSSQAMSRRDATGREVTEILSERVVSDR